MKYFFISVGTFAVACLMMGSAIEKGLKSPNVNIITTCVNVTSSVTPVSNLTNETVQQFSLSCSDNTESVKLQIAMAVTFMVGLIQVCITLSIKRYRPYEITYIFFQSFKACCMQYIFNFFTMENSISFLHIKFISSDFICYLGKLSLK